MVLYNCGNKIDKKSGTLAEKKEKYVGHIKRAGPPFLFILRVQFKNVLHRLFKIPGDFKRQHGRRYVFFLFDGINGLAADTNDLGQLLLGNVLNGPLYF